MQWKSIAGGIAGDLLGSAVSGAFGRSSAREQMRFQERMANTQFQRAAMDLEKAGLNRILSLGQPAAVPAGAQSSIESPKLGSTGIAAASARQQISLAKAMEESEEQKANMLHADARLKHAEADKQEVIKKAYEHFGPEIEKMFEGSSLSGTRDKVQSWFDKIKNWEDKQLERISSGARQFMKKYARPPQSEKK